MSRAPVGIEIFYATAADSHPLVRLPLVPNQITALINFNCCAAGIWHEINFSPKLQNSGNGLAKELTNSPTDVEKWQKLNFSWMEGS